MNKSYKYLLLNMNKRPNKTLYHSTETLFAFEFWPALTDIILNKYQPQALK